MKVEADVFAEGHDMLACEVRYRHGATRLWTAAAMASIGNDRWRADGARRVARALPLPRQGEGGPFRDLGPRPRGEGGDGTGARATRFAIGAELIEQAAARARGDDRAMLSELAAELRGWVGDRDRTPPGGGRSPAKTSALADNGDKTAKLVRAVLSDRVGRLVSSLSAAPRTAARPPFFCRRRSGQGPVQHLVRDVPALCVADQGTPRHLRGRARQARLRRADGLRRLVPAARSTRSARTGRKGRDGASSAGRSDPGSPWAIGASEGGHDAVHPELGTIEDFRELVADAAARGIDVALDLAFQASPDHPWVSCAP